MQPDLETSLFDVELGLDAFSGCTLLVPPLSSDMQPLFLHHGYVHPHLVRRFRTRRHSVAGLCLA